jgi:hypothetical protein
VRHLRCHSLESGAGGSTFGVSPEDEAAESGGATDRFSLHPVARNKAVAAASTMRSPFIFTRIPPKVLTGIELSRTEQHCTKCLPEGGRTDFNDSAGYSDFF